MSLPTRIVRVSAPDTTLISALVEQRPPAQGWTISRLDGPPEAESLVIIDFDTTDEMLREVHTTRSFGFAGPILVLGGSGVSGTLDDELLPRPIRLGALLARIDAHCTQPPSLGSFAIGPFQFDSANRMLRRATAPGDVRLTELECKILTHLALATGALVTREQLLTRVWGYSADADTHTVETHIWRLRQKIETGDEAARFVVTEAGGYRLLIAGSAQDE